MTKTKVRYEIESIIVKPGPLAAKLGTTIDIDPDEDTETLVEYRGTKAAAMKRAKQVYQRDVIKLQRSCWNSVTIQEQRYVRPYDEYPNIWDWEPVGDTEAIDSEEANQ